MSAELNAAIEAVRDGFAAAIGQAFIDGGLDMSEKICQYIDAWIVNIEADLTVDAVIRDTAVCVLTALCDRIRLDALSTSIAAAADLMGGLDAPRP